MVLFLPWSPRSVQETDSDPHPKIKRGRMGEIDTIVEKLEKRDDVTNDAVGRGSTSRGLKVLFLSSDTGGGHRASAESLAKQFQLQYPGSTYDLLDVITEDGCAPYNTLVQAYKHLSAHPKQWKIVYGVSNTRAYEMIADVHLKVTCERAIRKRIKSYNPDVVVSVHPLMTNVPVVSCNKISAETGRHLPMFTVVTDLGSAHSFWFANGVEKMFIASEQIRDLARSRGKVSDDKLVQSGLPIRHDFAVQAEALGDRMSDDGKRYQMEVRADLNIRSDSESKVVLVMGGGEGVGALSSIVDALFVYLTKNGIDATLLVVCGRNEELRKDLASRDWNEVLARHKNDDDSCWNGSMTPPTPGCLEGGVTMSLKRILSSNSVSNVGKIPDGDVIVEEGKTGELATLSASDDSSGGKRSPVLFVDSVAEGEKRGSVKVVDLGFVTRMAEYMVAADVLVSKAGPGTIAEAAAVGLPVMLTSFLPGQEEGNVDFVVDGEFGAFRSDADPASVAEEVSLWLGDSEKLRKLSCAARSKGAPNAAADIVKVIGDSTLHWKEINDAKGPETDAT